MDKLVEQLNSILPHYETYMNEKGLNDSSKKQYILRLSKFIEYMDDIFINPPSKLEYINEEHVYSFLDYKKEMGSSISSCDNYLRSIKAFYRFLYERGTLKNFILYDAQTELDRKKMSRGYDFFTQAEIFMIIDKAKVIYNNDPNFINCRNYLIILLIVYAALSLQEIHLLNDDDVNLIKRKLHITSGKSRSIYISEYIANVIEEYQELKSQFFTTKAFFISRQNNRLAKKSIQDAVKKVLVESGVAPDGRNLSPSTLRHTAIKTMIENGVELPIICNISGLDLNSLTKYFQLSSTLQNLKEQLYLEGHPLIIHEM